jgi:Transposase
VRGRRARADRGGPPVWSRRAGDPGVVLAAGAVAGGVGGVGAARVAGGKSDVFDSFVLAELARTDSHRFRVLVPDSDQTKALRAMTRARDSLVRTRIGLANQLRDQLACFWPGAGKVFWSVDTGIALAFLKRYPAPATLVVSVSSAWPRFSSVRDTPAASPPASCSRGCAAAPKVEPTSSKCRRGGRSCWRLSPPWSRSLRGSAS